MMRKQTCIFLLALAAALFACRQEVAPAPQVPVEFSARMPEAKGAPQLSTLERLAAQHFSVSAWYTPEGSSFGTGSRPYIRNHRFGLDGATWRGITAAGLADPVYYPLDGTLSYFCYAPYRADTGTASDICLTFEPDPAVTDRLPGYLPGSPLVCFTPGATPATQIDFIAATPLLDVDRGAGSIALDFTRHLTTDVQFWCKYTGTLEAEEGVVISRIAIRDVIGSEYLYFTERDGVPGHAWCSNVSPVDGGAVMPVASYVLSTGSLDLITEDRYLDSSTAKWVNNTINGRLYLLPQTLPAGACLDVTYVVKNRANDSNLDENVVSLPLSGTPDWPAGKTVRYTITVAVADRQDIGLSVSITDWANAGNTHASQELMY